MDYQTVLNKVIEVSFPNTKFNFLGKLEWYPVTERQKKRHFEKKGKELNKQRVQYSSLWRTRDRERSRNKINCYWYRKEC